MVEDPSNSTMDVAFRVLRVFGSVVRGSAEPASSLDLLEDLLNVRVDLVNRNGLRAELREWIEREAITLA